MANNEEGWDEFRLNDSIWVIPRRYIDIKGLGIGTFGAVM